MMKEGVRAKKSGEFFLVIIHANQSLHHLHLQAMTLKKIKLSIYFQNQVVCGSKIGNMK